MLSVSGFELYSRWVPLILCIKISPGTEDVSDAATVFVALAGKYGVDKATNKKENHII